MSQEHAQMVNKYESFLERSLLLQQEQRDVSKALLKNVQKISDNMIIHQQELAGIVRTIDDNHGIIKTTALVTTDTNTKVVTIQEKLLKYLFYSVLALLLVVGGISIARVIGSLFGLDFS